MTTKYVIGFFLTAWPLIALPAADNADFSGPDLYRRHCSSCHGIDGQGGVGVPISLPSFLASIDDEYLYKTIRLGRPGRVMPAFRSLRDREIRSIVTHIRTWSPARTPITWPPGKVTGNSARGARLYKKHCATCHGPEGQGGHGTGVTFSRPRGAPILAPALNNPGFLSAASDQLIRHTLIHGRNGTPMESFLKKGLTKRDINDIVVHVRTFERRSRHKSAQLLSTESSVMVRTSPYGFAETLDKVKTAIGAANMRLIRDQTVDQGIVPAGTENPDQTIVYSCDFKFLNDALKVDPRVGLFLPCRVNVIRHHDKVLVMSINPKRLSRIFNNSELNELCEQMYHVYEAILDEVVL